MIQDGYDDLYDTEEAAPAPAQQGNSYVPPAAQTALGKQFDTFFVKAYKDGEKPFTEDYRDIDKAASRASYLHFKEEWGTRLIAINLTTHVAEELRWKDRDTGYAIYRRD
jgi:hypothetical protein